MQLIRARHGSFPNQTAICNNSAVYWFINLQIPFKLVEKILQRFSRILLWNGPPLKNETIHAV